MRHGFKKTVGQIRKIKPLPLISYMAISVVFGWLLDTVSGWGGLAYAITTVIVPTVTSVADAMSKTEIVNSLLEEWAQQPWLFHCLVVLIIGEAWFIKNEMISTWKLNRNN